MHPWDRLHRRVTGQHLGEPRALAVALCSRDREPRATRVLAGETVKRADTKVKAAQNTTRAEPNAPLLKRVVRHPFALDTTRGKRSAIRDAVPWALLDRAATPTVTDLTRDLHIGASLPNPILAYGSASRLEPRPRISADAWLEGRNE